VRGGSRAAQVPAEGRLGLDFLLPAHLLGSVHPAAQGEELVWLCKRVMLGGRRCRAGLAMGPSCGAVSETPLIGTH